MQSVCGFLEGTEVMVLCIFAEGSLALGCKISLNSVTVELSRNSSTGLATGKILVNAPLTNSYAFYAQDIEADGSISPLHLPGLLSEAPAACNYSKQNLSGTVKTWK